MSEITKSLKELGRAIPYYPRLGKALGGMEAAIFFQQLIYWTPRTRDEAAGWIYKTMAEIEKETGLTPEKQETIRKRLRDLGILEEKYKRLVHRKYYRVNDKNFDRFWSEFLKKEEAEEPEKEEEGIFSETVSDGLGSPSETEWEIRLERSRK